MKFREMPNIGPVLEKQLLTAGIDTPETLKELGSKEAFRRILSIDEGACLHLLCALHGAVEGVRKHDLPKETKQELKEYYYRIKGKSG